MKKVVIIGAGPAGLSAARVLSENGYKVVILEESESVGGMSKSLKMFNQIVDVGPHRFFSKDKRLNDFWLSHTRGQYEQVNRLTRIFYNNKFFYYPLRGFDALKKLGIIESIMCVLSYFKAKIRPFKGDSFESWVANAFGYRLYSIFFKSYTEKLWGIKCDELDSDFAAQRIKGLNLYEAAKAAFFGGGGKKHKTLVDCFSYPKKGCGVVYENMADSILKSGGEILLNCKVTGILTKDKKACGVRFIESNSQDSIESKSEDSKEREIECDIVISTAPFKDMVLSLSELDSNIKDLASNLKFRNTILVYVEIDSKDSRIFADNWIYVHNKATQTGRITDFANWTKDLICGQNAEILCLEYWANDDEKLWNLDSDSMIEIAKKDLLDSKLVKDSNLIKDAKVLKIHKSYPVYERGYKENLHKIYAALGEFKDLYFIGRNGAFKYNNQDHSILMGLMCADKILGKDVDLWNINTDYDYQESGKSMESKES
ncbi:FAD-dependent oxidoreductase [Helicobacter saguini]|uniref:FAD-dependent oxidoreductase n=1 Tax=Helicobacter saguini TaxID=1548018 RepID=A0A347VQZ9_9HELI|nr:FAD-dependent oxidoreductase [Helicobacter saguini]MWV63094.1 FAD-dependent oxidoreductase [Helicobacter saguini]MWV66236.1 FAD-dependent oxidoreductase [Helicobacter saguini]MWV68588.1 FAD-dependent oxidoreductase [Helicobacter saguini]MWV71860.1 FAD-dependent oxidoreductase [Helicobacter saguini]TLD95878.1 FAD-dependent oxidoreductase [Helicobacter saguini]